MPEMIEAEPLNRDGIRHGFFTRHGGVSGGLYASLNIGLGSKDDRANILENRARAARAVGAGDGRIALPFQYHSADAVVVETAWPPGESPRADAVATALPGIALGVSTADCGPVLFADPDNRVIAAAHAGWRGALAGITDSAIAAMEGLGADRSRIVAVLGPTISPPAYEVGEDFHAEFCRQAAENAAFFDDGPNGKHHFDLPGYILHRLKLAGIAHAESLDRCTYTQEEDFFSYRRATHRQEPDYGRLVSAIALSD